MPEIRVLQEGTLRWVLASGQTGTAWSTAATPTSGLVGFIQPGWTFNDPREYATPEDRGIPSHHKLIRRAPVEASFRVLEGVTADWPINVATATGSTVPAFHLEWKQAVPAVEAATTGIYYRIHRCVLLDAPVTEQAEGNVHEFRVRGLIASGPSNTGYLS